MNTVEFKPPPIAPEQSDLYTPTSGDGDLYILSRVGENLFTCVSLNSGNRYHEACKSLEAAITGMTFVARNAKLRLM